MNFRGLLEAAPRAFFLTFPSTGLDAPGDASPAHLATRRNQGMLTQSRKDAPRIPPDDTNLRTRRTDP